MKALLLLILLVACCSLPGICAAAPATPSVTPFVSATSASVPAGGSDAFVGQGDLITRAVPVCCCSSSAGCDTDPPPPVGTPCKAGSPVCKCGGGIACIAMP